MSNARHYIITVDGPSGSGKSTVCRRVAARLGIGYIDTGAMYRCVAWATLQQGIDLDDRKGLSRLLDEIDIRFQAAGTENLVLCNGSDVTRAIRTPEIDRLASAVSAIDIVRQALLPLQRAAARNNSAIIDGRDAGTVIFPEADLKIFLTADLEVRARRRLQDQKDQDGIDLESVMEAIRKRDRDDSSRAHAPLKKAADAITIDTSKLSIDEVCERIINLVHTRILNQHD
ncbi:MAG: (d)CMP kinase [Deltaproteobacteria bacterium]|nr:(d)CMP kinase [Deltaproteobacteria bacterium]